MLTYDLNCLAQCLENIKGSSSGTESISYKFLGDNGLQLQYICVVHIASDASLTAQTRRESDRSIKNLSSLRGYGLRKRSIIKLLTRRRKKIKRCWNVTNWFKVRWFWKDLIEHSRNHKCRKDGSIYEWVRTKASWVLLHAVLDGKGGKSMQILW